MSRLALALCFALVPAACRTVAPGEEEERRALEEAGAPYSRPFAERDLPEVRADSSYVDLLDRALRADPRIEEAYFAWAASIGRAVQAGALPNPFFGIGWMITEPPGEFWENILAAFSFAIPPSSRREAATAMALEEARAARVRFEALRFYRKGRFRQLYAELDAAAREAELAARDRAFLEQLEGWTRSRIAAGKGSTDAALRLRIEIAKAANAADAARAELRDAAARVNAAMSRDAFAPLDPPPPLRRIELDATDERLLRLALSRNPEVRALAPEVEARRKGIDLARAGGAADLSFEYRREGTENMPMLGFSLPLQRDKVRAAIAEAEARLKETEAKKRALANDVAAETAHAIRTFREAERREAFFGDRVKPLAADALSITGARYAAGEVSFLEVIEARRSLLEIERAIERARTDRERAVGDLLACCGADVHDLTSS